MCIAPLTGIDQTKAEALLAESYNKDIEDDNEDEYDEASQGEKVSDTAILLIPESKSYIQFQY